MKKENIVKAGFFSALSVLAIVLLLVFANTSEVVQENVIEKMDVLREPILVTGDPDPDVTGFYYCKIYPHSGDPYNDYAVNLTNASSYEYSDVGNTTMTGETPYETTFDIVIKIGINDDDGLYTGNSSWSDGYSWMLLTCADLSIGADTNMSWVEIGTDGTDYRWIHYFLDNDGSGYTISEGASFNITSAKFYVQRVV